MTKIPYRLLKNCYSLKEVELSPNTIEIENEAFLGCKSLIKLEIPESTQYIRSKAFCDCCSLKDVIVKGDTHIEFDSFAGCESIEFFSYRNANEEFLFTHLSDSQEIHKVNNGTNEINVKEVLLKKESELKINSILYNGYGMNITKIRGRGDDYKSFKDLDNRWPYTLEDFFDNEQSKEMLYSENWHGNSGIGLVLGFNNYRAIDVDGVNDFSDITYDYELGLRNLANDFLEILGLPKDYSWLIKSGSGHGFHIIFKCDKLQSEFASKSYTPNLHYVYNRWNSTRKFERLEIRWRDHLILPPSIHVNGGRYEFINGLPNTMPSTINLSKIDSLIQQYCGRVITKDYSYKSLSITLAEYCKCFAKYDSWSYAPEAQEDTIEWLEKADTPEALNSLGLKYLLGKNVPFNPQKAKDYFVRSKSDVSNFNLASLIAGGLFYGTFDDVKFYLSQIKDRKTFSYVDYNNYDDSITKKLFDDVLRNAYKVLQPQVNSSSYTKCLLFFDTETTGLPKNYNAPCTDVFNWPRLVQLSWLLTSTNGNVISKGNYIIKPNGFIIPQDSVAIHGITTIKALEEGIELKSALQEFLKALEKTSIIIGHNIDYDKNIIGAEFIRLGLNNDLLDSKQSFCTMKSTIDFCKIPGHLGYKYPSLQDLYNKLFNCNFENAHNSESDISATMKCYFELRNRGLIK